MIHTLGGGGAEKALVNLVNNLDTKKYDITVETMFDDGVNAKNLKPHIHYISKKAPCPKGISVILKCLPAKMLYRYFIDENEYDVIIAYMHGVPVKVITANKEVKKIAWLHNGNPKTSTMFTSWATKKRAFGAYASCDAVVGVCQSVADAFSQYTGITYGVKVVYNTLDVDLILKNAKQEIPLSIDNQLINLVSTGRLGKEKGYNRLIDVCSELKNEGYRFHLYLIGSGAEEESLKKQVRALSLEKDITFLGFQDNPYKYLDKCNLFVCSSYTEGLSTATIEALLLGKAIISTDVSGAREILGNNEYGMIVDNTVDGIKQGIMTFFDNPEMITMYGSSAKKHSYEFNVAKTVKQAEIVIDEVLK